MAYSSCVRRRKNALLIQIGVEIVWDNIDWMNWAWDAYLALPADFTGADDIITNLAKKREPGDNEHTPLSLIITSKPVIYEISSPQPGANISHIMP